MLVVIPNQHYYQQDAIQALDANQICVLAWLQCMGLLGIGRDAKGGPVVPPISSMPQEQKKLAIEDCMEM